MVLLVHKARADQRGRWVHKARKVLLAVQPTRMTQLVCA